MVASFCGDFLSFPQKVDRQKSSQNDDLLLSMKYSSFDALNEQAGILR
jgi:hypothetical protein